MVAAPRQERAHRPLSETPDVDVLAGEALDVTVAVVVTDLGKEHIDPVGRSLKNLMETGCGRT